MLYFILKIAILKPNEESDSNLITFYVSNKCKHANNYDQVSSSEWSARISGCKLTILIRNVRTLLLYVCDGILSWIQPLLHSRSVSLYFDQVLCDNFYHCEECIIKYLFINILF